MRFVKNRILLLVLILLASMAVSCSSVVLEDQSAYITENLPAIPPGDDIKTLAGGDFADMQKITSEGDMAFYMNLDTAEFCVENSATGQRYFSNPPGWDKDPSASSDTMNELGSQLIVEYFAPDTTQGTMNSYKDSFLSGQLKTEIIDHGVRATYQIGTANPLRAFPTAMRGREFEKYLSKIPEGVQKKITGAYRLIDMEKASDKAIAEIEKTYRNIRQYETVYVIRPNLGNQLLKSVEKEFMDAGCTYDVVLNENEVLGFEDTASLKASFIIEVEYKIDGNGFTAEILSEKIRHIKGFSLTGIRLLPYFGAADKTATGAMLVPDGSGALIQLNKDISRGYTYHQSIYGEDPALVQTAKTQYTSQVYLPVYAMLSSANPFLAIAEEGEAAGSISAAIAGGISSYNNIHFSFAPKTADYQNYNLTTGISKGYSLPLVHEKENFRVRYIPLDSKDAGYVSAAIIYREYLEGKNIISGETAYESVPLTVELVGAVDKRKTFIGIPYRTLVPLTSFDDARIIIQEFIDSGIPNLNVRYTAWSNNGLRNSAYNKIRPIREMGGTKGLVALTNYLSENDVGFYPDLELTYVGSNSAFDGFSPARHAARRVNRQIAGIRPLNVSTGAAKADAAQALYVLSASQKNDYLASGIAYLNQYGIGAVSLMSAGNVLSSDFNQAAPVMRAGAQKLLENALDENAGDKIRIMTDGANAYLLPYTDWIVNMPMGISEFSIEDQSVPFYQIVLHGSRIQYSGEALNMATDFRRNLLRSAETGASLYCKLMGADNYTLAGTERYELYSISAQNWQKDLIGLYKEYNAKIAPVINAKISGHHPLSDGVNITEFANGYVIITNYQDQPVHTEFGEVEGKGYLVSKGGMSDGE
ncbi:MAG: DUF5696 domain-containing protein [Saccharofermentanales bacterium]